MAKLCEQCGKRNNPFVGDAFYLNDDKFLCCHCAKHIREDINNLYYVKTQEEFQTLKNQIILNTNCNYNDRVKEYVQILVNKIYDKIYERLDFVKQTNQTDSSPINDNIGPFENKDISSTELNNNAEELRVTSDSIGMFGNIGGKIKTLAQVVTWIGIIGSVICGFVLMGIDDDLIFTGFIIALFGSLSSWVSSFVLYGFGQLIENTDKLVELAKNKKSD